MGEGRSAERPSGLTAIAIVGRNGVIGDGADQPWHIPADQARFRRLTMGASVIVGRRTYAAIGGALPGRRMIVLSRSRRTPADVGGSERDVQFADDLDEAVRLARAGGRRVFVAGGDQIYRLAWDSLTRLEITVVDDNPAGCAMFPPIDPADWALQSTEVVPASTDHPRLEFQTWALRATSER